MSDIGIGAVGAAFIAAAISLISLIIGKEQKISEFRQSWIDELRKSLVSYLVSINAISDALRVQKASNSSDKTQLLSIYRALNEASLSIGLRINSDEPTAAALLKSMTDFEILAGDNARLTPENIKSIEQDFVSCSRRLLKFEWSRVKRGENTFVLMKRGSFILVVGLVLLLGYLTMARSNFLNLDGALLSSRQIEKDQSFGSSSKVRKFIKLSNRSKFKRARPKNR